MRAFAFASASFIAQLDAVKLHEAPATSTTMASTTMPTTSTTTDSYAASTTTMPTTSTTTGGTHSMVGHDGMVTTCDGPCPTTMPTSATYSAPYVPTTGTSTTGPDGQNASGTHTMTSPGGVVIHCDGPCPTGPMTGPTAAPPLVSTLPPGRIIGEIQIGGGPPRGRKYYKDLVKTFFPDMAGSDKKLSATECPEVYRELVAVADTDGDMLVSQSEMVDMFSLYNIHIIGDRSIGELRENQGSRTTTDAMALAKKHIGMVDANKDGSLSMTEAQGFGNGDYMWLHSVLDGSAQGSAAHDGEVTAEELADFYFQHKVGEAAPKEDKKGKKDKRRRSTDNKPTSTTGPDGQTDPYAASTTTHPATSTTAGSATSTTTGSTTGF